MHRRLLLTAGAAGLTSSVTAQSAHLVGPSGPLPFGATFMVAASDAPPVVRRAATFRCDGVDDQVEIQDAIAAVGAVGGQVSLSAGTFHLTGAVRVSRRVALVGSGRATILRAHGTWAAFDGTLPGALVECFDAGTDKTHVASLALDGNRWQGADVKGLYYSVTTDANFDEGPDAAHTFRDIYVHRTRSHGVHLTGGRMRGTKMSGVRILDAGAEGDTVAHGFLIDSPDGFYDQLESGSSSGSGFYIEGANNRFSNSKSWYSDLSGWQVRTPRNQFAACESQDNEQHGFYITTGPNSFSACHADSNSWNSAAPTSAYDGFHLPWGSRVQLVGCAAYDKNESQRGYWQRHGFYLGSAAEHCQVLGVARDNASTATGGAGATSATNLVFVNG